MLGSKSGPLENRLASVQNQAHPGRWASVPSGRQRDPDYWWKLGWPSFCVVSMPSGRLRDPDTPRASLSLTSVRCQCRLDGSEIQTPHLQGCMWQSVRGVNAIWTAERSRQSSRSRPWRRREVSMPSGRQRDPDKFHIASEAAHNPVSMPSGRQRDPDGWSAATSCWRLVRAAMPSGRQRDPDIQATDADPDAWILRQCHLDGREIQTSPSQSRRRDQQRCVNTIWTADRSRHHEPPGSGAGIDAMQQCHLDGKEIQTFFPPVVETFAEPCQCHLDGEEIQTIWIC